MIRWWTRPFYLKITYVDRYIKETNGIPTHVEVVEVDEGQRSVCEWTREIL